MNGYRVQGVIGDGSFGSVLQAVHLQSGETVAIKRLKRRYASIDDAMRLREVQALRELQHPCIVRLREAVYEEQQLSLVFEHLPLNLHQMLRQRTGGIADRSVRHMMQQLLSAVSHLHGRGLFHRDIKPENLLIRGADCEAEAETGTEAAAALPVLKLADFGQAKPIRSVPPFTEYVSTRWYRAPELLLRSASYSSPVDVWAAGCVLAELLTLQPLFPGTGEVDVLRRIAACIGPPSASCWPDGAALVAKAGLTFAAAAATDSLQQLLRARCPTVSDEAVALLSALLCWDPRRRVSARQALQHPYFTARQGREEGEEEGSSAEGGVDEVEAELRLLDSASNEPSIRPSAASPPRSLSERRQSGAADRMGDGRWRQGACAASAAAVERVEPPALQPAAPPSRPASAALRPSSARPPLLPTAVGAAVNLSFSSLSASRPSSVQSSRETAEQRHSRFVHAANAMMR